MSLSIPAVKHLFQVWYKRCSIDSGYVTKCTYFLRARAVLKWGENDGMVNWTLARDL